jgi:hypothetical protein
VLRERKPIAFVLSVVDVDVVVVEEFEAIDLNVSFVSIEGEELD